jgi:hypothetical protein
LLLCLIRESGGQRNEVSRLAITDVSTSLLTAQIVEEAYTFPGECLSWLPRPNHLKSEWCTFRGERARVGEGSRMLNVAPDLRFFTDTLVQVITTNAVDSHALCDLHYSEWMNSDF